MAKKGVYVDLNQLADVLMRKKKKKRRRRRVRQPMATQAQQESTRNPMIRTPYAQQTLYGAGNFNVAGDKFDAGIQAEKQVGQLKQEISGIEKNVEKQVETGKAVVADIRKQLDTELQLIMDKSTEPTAKRSRGRPKKNLSIKNRSSGMVATIKANAPVVAQAQVSTKMNRPKRPAISTVGSGMVTAGDGIVSAEGNQGGGGVAPDDVVVTSDVSEPVAEVKTKRKYVKSGLFKKSDVGKLKPEQLAPFTPNFQNKASAQQEQKITDVLQPQQDMSGEI
jgi:hypothetical protein